MSGLAAITLWQPWASLIACGAKPYETRSWAPPHDLVGQRIAIHAAKKFATDDALKGLLHATCMEEFGCSYNFTLPRGAVVCTVTLKQIYRLYGPDKKGRIIAQPPGNGWTTTIPADAFGDYSRGRWDWHLTDVEPLDSPIPAQGKQGIWLWEGMP